jgi:hypothetical protein
MQAKITRLSFLRHVYSHEYITAHMHAICFAIISLCQASSHEDTMHTQHV